MVRVLDLTERNDGTKHASLDTSMEQADSLSFRDFALTAAVVMPSSMVWIASERATFAIMLGCAIYLALGHGLPALRNHRLYFRQVARLYAHLRSLVTSRTARQA